MGMGMGIGTPLRKPQSHASNVCALLTRVGGEETHVLVGLVGLVRRHLAVRALGEPQRDAVVVQIPGVGRGDRPHVADLRAVHRHLTGVCACV